MINFFNFNIVEIGLFFIGIGYVYTFWRQGGVKVTAEVLQVYKAQADLNTQKITELTNDVGMLKGQLIEKDKQISLLQALAKTTPEQQVYMDDMRKFTAGVADYMANSTKTLGEVSVFMHNLNKK